MTYVLVLMAIQVSATTRWQHPQTDDQKTSQPPGGTIVLLSHHLQCWLPFIYIFYQFYMLKVITFDYIIALRYEFLNHIIVHESMNMLAPCWHHGQSCAFVSYNINHWFIFVHIWKGLEDIIYVDKGNRMFKRYFKTIFVWLKHTVYLEVFNRKWLVVMQGSIKLAEVGRKIVQFSSWHCDLYNRSFV